MEGKLFVGGKHVGDVHDVKLTFTPPPKPRYLRLGRLLFKWYSRNSWMLLWSGSCIVSWFTKRREAREPRLKVHIGHLSVEWW